MLVCCLASGHWLGNSGRRTGASRARRHASRLRSSSWQLSSLLWSAWSPSGPPAETHDGKVAVDTEMTTRQISGN